jgi:LPS-assembly lipoprotein
MTATRRLLFAFALLAILTLPGCGFKLRGAADIALPFKTICLRLPENSPLLVQLKRYIRAGGGTQIVDDPKTADAILEVVLPDRREKVILSLNGAGQPVEYTLFYKFSFRVRDNHDHELLPATSLTLKRDQSFNAAQAIAKQTEEESLYRDMQADMVQQILRRLVALKPIQ